MDHEHRGKLAHRFWGRLRLCPEATVRRSEWALLVVLLANLSFVNLAFAGPEPTGGAPDGPEPTGGAPAAAPAGAEPLGDPAGGATFRPLLIEYATNGVPIALPLVVVLQEDGRPPVEAQLADGGLMPDEAANDGTYSGAMWFSGAGATVSARVGEHTLTAGAVAIPGTKGPRFLRMESVDGLLQVSAFSPRDTTPVGAGSDTLPEMSGGGGPGGGRPAPGEPPDRAGGGSSIRSLIIAVVAGLLGAFGGHALGQRSRA